MHHSSNWFECLLSSLIQCSEQWNSSSDCRELEEICGLCLISPSPSSTSRCRGRSVHAFNVGVLCSDGGNWRRSGSTLLSRPNTGLYVHVRQISRGGWDGSFLLSNERKERKVGAEQSVLTLLISSYIITGRCSSPITMTCLFWLGSINIT